MTVFATNSNPVVTPVDALGNVIGVSTSASSSGDGSATAQPLSLYNSGGPGGSQYDRWRSLQGKARISTTVSAASLGQPQVILNAGPVPAVGQAILLSGGTPEVGYVISVAGQTVTLSANLATTHANGSAASWDGYNINGPQTNGIDPIGVAVVGDIIYDAVALTYQMIQGRSGVPYMSTGGASYVTVAAGVAGDTVIKASAGRLCRIIVTATAANAMQLFDNAAAGAGNIIGQLPANPVLGPVAFDMPATAGITVKGSATNPAVTVSFF